MIELTKVDKKDRIILERLLQLYLHEITIYFPIDIDNDGLYHYHNIDNYFNNDNNIAYFIKENNTLVGFILFDIINNQNIIQEIFIINNYKRNGFAKKAVFKLFENIKGEYIVKALPNSKVAELFWINTIKEYTKDNYKVEYVGKYNRAEFTFMI